MTSDSGGGNRLIPASHATTTLIEIYTTVQKAQDVVDLVDPVLSELLVIVVKIDTYIGDALSVLNFVDDVCNILHEGLKFCQYLGELIPEVGPILADAASDIESLNIEQTVKNMVNDVRIVIQNARNDVTAKVRKIASLISGEVAKIKALIPAWLSTVKILKAASELSDAICYAVLGISSDAFLKELMEKALGHLPGLMKTVGDAVEAVKGFVVTIWDHIRDDIIRPLENGFGKVLDVLSNPMRVVKACLNVCGTIKSWFEPFFWILDAIQWLWEHTIGWLIKKVMDELHISAWVQSFIDTIEHALGIDDMEKSIKDFLLGKMGKLLGNISQVKVGEDQQGSISSSVKDFGNELKAFRQHPAEALYRLIKTEIWDKYVINVQPDENGLSNWVPEAKRELIDTIRARYGLPPITKPSLVLLSLPVTPPPSAAKVRDPLPYRYSKSRALFEVDEGTKKAAKNEAIAQIQAVQTDMDSFVSSIRSFQTVMLADVSTAPPVRSSHTSNLTLAMHNDMSVPVIMRTKHADALAKRKSTKVDSPCMDPTKGGFAGPVLCKPVQEIVTPDEFNQHFGDFNSHYAQLDVSFTAAIDAVKQLKESSQAAAEAFAAHDQEVRDFAQHLGALVDAVGVPYQDMKDLMDLPFKYQTGLTRNLERLFFFISGDVVDSTLNNIYYILDLLEAKINTLEAERVALSQNGVQSLKTAYAAMLDHVNKITSTDLFPSTLGLAVTDLPSFADALLQRIDSERTTFVFIHQLGQTIIKEMKNPDLLSGDKAKQLIDLLNKTYSAVAPVMQGHTDTFKQLASAIPAALAPLDTLRGDVERFFAVIDSITAQCRRVEGKLIALSKGQDVCRRIEVAIAPFEQILVTFGVQTDRVPAPEDILQALDHPTLGKGTLLATLFEALPEIAVDVLEAMLEEYFELGTITREIDSAISQLNNRSENDIVVLDQALRKLVEIVSPSQRTTYSPSGGTAKDKTFILANPALSNESAAYLKEVFTQTSQLSSGVSIPGDEQNAIPGLKDKRLISWSSPDVNGDIVISLQLLVWVQAWEEKHPGTYTGRYFLEWYDSLYRLVRIYDDWNNFEWRSFPQPVGDDFDTAVMMRNTVCLHYYSATWQALFINTFQSRAYALCRGNIDDLPVQRVALLSGQVEELYDPLLWATPPIYDPVREAAILSKVLTGGPDFDLSTGSAKALIDYLGAHHPEFDSQKNDQLRDMAECIKRCSAFVALQPQLRRLLYGGLTFFQKTQSVLYDTKALETYFEALRKIHDDIKVHIMIRAPQEWRKDLLNQLSWNVPLQYRID